MILYINTTDNKQLEVCLKKSGRILASEKIAAERAQGEKLLPAAEAVLKKAKIKLKDLKGIEVENRGGSFTSLRIGIATANAFGFALGIPVRGATGDNHPQPLLRKEGRFNVVEPEYNGEPDIK